MLSSPLDLQRLVWRSEKPGIAILRTRVISFQFLIASVFALPVLWAFYRATVDPFLGTYLVLLLFRPLMLGFATALLTHRAVVRIDKQRQIIIREDRLFKWSKVLKAPLLNEEKVIVKHDYDHDLELRFHVSIPGADFAQLQVLYDLALARRVAAFIAETAGLTLVDQTLLAEPELRKTYGRRMPKKRN